MALFDPLVREVADKFNLGQSADRLVGEVARFIANPQTGGIAGFLERFRKAGLNDIVASWVGRGENQPLSAGQMEQVLGKGFISDIASKLNLSAASLAAPIAFIIPKIINLLTPDGVVPTTLPAGLTRYLAPEAPPTVGVPLAETAAKSGFGRYWWVLALALLLAIAGYFSFFKPEPKVATTPPPATQVAQVPPRLAITNSNGQIKYGGVVKDEQTKTTIVDTLKRVFGEGNIFGNIAVDPNTQPAAWLDKLGTALEKFKLPGLEAMFEGASVYIGGAVSDLDRSNLIADLKGLFGSGFSVGSLTDRVNAAIRSATDRTLAALAALKPGFTAPDLVKALNLSIINFDTGSAELSAEAKAFIEKWATGIKAAPAGTVIEIRGHTDSTGDAATNLPLSRARADAVRVALISYGVPPTMLVAKGYGDTQPIASNDTPDGRFQNRRIEFVVVQ